ncbi:unnamed protein product [Prunus armeniaca]
MEGSKRMFSTVFILVLLLVAIGTGPMVAEGKMEGSKRMFSTVFILVLLLVAIGTGPMVAEGKDATKETSRTCESLSTKFKGFCFRSSSCADACQKEGFLGGKCPGFRLGCTCTKKC